MFIGFARYDLRLRDSSSLKDKRSVLKSLESSLHQRFRCAVAEVGHQQLRQRAAVGVSIITETPFRARQLLTEIGRRVETHPGVELIDALVDVISAEDPGR